nr:conserved hypothetical protein [Rhizobiaceae bacterium]
MQAALVDDEELFRDGHGGRRTLFAAQDAACHVDIFAAGLGGVDQRLLHVVLAADAGKLDQHGKVHAGDHLDAVAAHHGNGEVRGGAAEHVGEDDDAMALVGLHHRFQDILAALVHVVLGADADGLDRLLRTNDMFKGVPEFLRKLAMGDKHQSDHQQSLQFPNSNGRRNTAMQQFRPPLGWPSCQ